MNIRRIPIAAGILTLFTLLFVLSNPTSAQSSVTNEPDAPEKEVVPEPFYPQTLQDWLAIVGIPIAAVWTIVTFATNNRIKAAEILTGLEKDYAQLIPTLLRIENETDFEEIFLRPIRISNFDEPRPESLEDRKEFDKSIDDLEKVLRYFFVCENARRLGVNSKAIDRLCGWYLRVLVTDKKNGSWKRPDLRKYILNYWPSVFYWAELASEPFPKRLLIYLNQVPDRLYRWWNGTWARPPVDRAVSPESNAVQGQEASGSQEKSDRKSGN